MSFDEFAQVCERLAETGKKLEKRALMAELLARLNTADAALAAIYLAGQPFAETDRRALNVGGALLTKAVAQLSGASDAALHAAYRRHGDLGSAAFDLLAAKTGGSLTLAGVEESFSALATARGPAAKLRLLLDLLQRATPLAAKYLIKLILGDMRTGVKQSLVEEAIAVASHAEVAAVRRALMVNGSLPEVVVMARAGTLADARMRLFHPLGFMLASPVDSVEEALARFSEAIAEPPEQEATLRHAQVEDKYDGMRAQLHCGDASQPGRVEIFSRNREDIGSSFPELIEAFSEAFAGIDEAVILDGEILAWSPRQQALPFSALQQRLGRKRVSAELRRQVPVVFMAFDLLYAGDALLLDQPLHARRQRLAHIVARAAASTGKPSPRAQGMLFASAEEPHFPRLLLAPATRLESKEQLDRAYHEARARGNEGVMLKAADSLYQPGRRGLAWLKLKRQLATLDVVVTGVEFGHGRRAGVLSDYTFAVRDGDELKNVGKAYSGLTDAEINDLTLFFKQHTLEEFGGFRTVEPLLVLEVAFNNVMRSSRHASGFALRFPRILRLRQDKPVSEIDTLARVEEIYASQPDKPQEEATAG
ncbi:ATP-dependent DNA ligase [Acidipila rosea]|uniref:DNA ligase n=1 Tax=Acidipila rosea TaxID=768535 RepID=A0A4R1L9R3_9BACT|nr:ATP-dependent DNA ligase [Acidipila rosea]TCK75108.1 DNA ligase-1 [Acidipila rosea]